MLILQGILRAAMPLGGNTNKKTGEVYPVRQVIQLETVDGRGLVKMETITVPTLDGYTEKIGSTVNVPVRAWAAGNVPINYMYEPQGAAA